MGAFRIARASRERASEPPVAREIPHENGAVGADL
jgi:hypothetical protein